MAVIKTHLIRVSREREEDQKRQLKILVKVGYMADDKFRELRRHSVTIRDELNNIYRVTDKQYERLQSSPPNEQRLKLFEIEKKVKKIVLDLVSAGKSFSVKEINNRLYSIQSEEASIHRVKSWNEFLNEVSSSKEDIEYQEEEIDRIEEAIKGASKQNQNLTDEEIDNIKDAVGVEISVEKEKKYVKSLSFEERYNKGKFNKDDIIEVFGYCWSKNPKNGDPYVPESYKALILHLADFCLNESKVNMSLSSFNLKWVDRFLTFKYNKGYPKAHIKGYSPFDVLTYSNKLVNAEREVFTVARFRKIVEFLKQYIDILQKHNLISMNAINTKHIEASDYISRKVNTDNFTRIEYTLDYEEIEQLLTASFVDEKMQLATDMYIIQMYAGGLRPSELYNGELRFESNYVTFYRSKNKKIAKNPILPEVETILNKYPDGLPTFLPIEEYRVMLKKVAQELKWNRRIDVPNTKLNAEKATDKCLLHEIFYPLTARKSFVNYLANLGLPDDLIIQFTDQSDVKILRHYKKSLNLQQKKVVIQNMLERWAANVDSSVIS